MKIVINNNRKIFAIQEEFSGLFPGLKIGFFAKPNKSGGPPSPKMVTHSSKTLQECRAISREGTIEILPSMNINELKNNFRDIFGLSVEIFQKGENSSNEIPVSGNVTIEETSKLHSVPAGM